MKKELIKLKQEVGSCEKCELHKTRNRIVFGEGDENAKIMFIGEAPGHNEDMTGRPFVGRAGQVFKELLNSVNLIREDVYIANVLKCRPPSNRNPTSNEIKKCTPYLNKQIRIINPEIIACLGNFATKHVMKEYGLSDKIQGISKIHGYEFKIKNLLGTKKIIPLYHPAVVVYNNNLMPVLKQDFEKLIKNQ